MFREAVFDVGDLVRPGKNTLALLFDRPLGHVGEEHPDQWGRNPERVYMRKAQFGFGWDWEPRLPTVGIWRPIEPRRELRATVRGVYFYNLDIDPKDERAAVAVRVEAEAGYQVRRLRSHPCLALWCGNNENQWIHDRTFWNREDTTVPGALYYHEVLPCVVAELDGRTPYWPGSPFGETTTTTVVRATSTTGRSGTATSPAASVNSHAGTLRRRMSLTFATPRT